MEVCNFFNYSLYIILESINWEKIIPKGDIPLPRYSHTMIYYNNEIIIFGGSIIESNTKTREDIVIFNTQNNKIYIPERTFNRSEVKWRKGHVCVNIKNYLLIHGGINEIDYKNSDTDNRPNFNALLMPNNLKQANRKEIIIQDIWIFNLSILKWEPLEYKGEPYPAVAYHSCCVAINNEKLNNKNFELYKNIDSNIKAIENIHSVNITNNSVSNKLNSPKYKHEGIYFFGGIDKNNNNYNELRYLKVGKKPCEWIIPNTKGKPPKSRNSASLNYYEELNILILYGGKNLNEYNNYEYFNDFYVYDLENLHWYKAKIEYDQCLYKNILSFNTNNKILNNEKSNILNNEAVNINEDFVRDTNNVDNKSFCKTNFSSCILGSKLILFGGIDSNNNFISSDVFYINLDLLGKYRDKDIENNNYKSNENTKIYKPLKKKIN